MKILITATLVATLVSTTALASSKTIAATVTEVTPQYKTITVQHPYQDCSITYQNQTTTHNNYDPGDALIGGIIGGVIGNQFGKGNGKAVTTGVGVLLGSQIGARHSGHSYGTTSQVPVRTCVTRYNFTEENQFMGNVIRWEAVDGVTGSFQTTRPYRVGDSVNVRVNYSVQW